MSRRLSLVSSFVVAVALVACGEVKPSVIDAPPGTIDAAVDAQLVDVPDIDTPPNAVTLTIVRGGNASGTITSDPAGIDCGAGCSGGFPPGTLVTLTATPGAGAGFTGWGGGCSGALTTCSVQLGSSAVAVNANFDTLRHNVTVTSAGNGSGTIAAASIDINCPGTCMATVDHGTSATFTATAQAGSTFLGWSGACTGTAACTLTIDDDTQLSAAFGQSQSLIVTKSGSGTGTVTSVPAGINCGTDCSEVYPANQMVTLTATAAADSLFGGWTGACTNVTGTCVVTVAAATSVNAVFNLRQFTLTATRAGTGIGTITSTTAGINCGLDCSESYNINTAVTLVATPGGDSTFSGWSGACTNATGECNVTMSAARTVTARFDATTTVVLTLTVRGGGRVTVVTTPISGATSCTSPSNGSNTCMATFARDTPVSLRATPATGNIFSDWTGCTSFSGTSCDVTMNVSKVVDAFFCLTGTC